jgi:transcriptional regulator with XRE-family HTH domain
MLNRFAQRRKALGFTQEELAYRVGVDRTTVMRWECGHCKPQPWARPKLARVLEVTRDRLDDLLAEADDLDRVRTADAGHVPVEPNDMNRRELLRLCTMAGAALATLPAEPELDWERMALSPESGRLDGRTLDEYEALNAHLWRVFVLSTSKRDALPPVRQQLYVLSRWLRQPHTRSITRRLCALASELFQLAGEISFDANHYVESAQCYTLAATAAREASAFDLWACAMTRHAYVAIYERLFDQAGNMLDAAASFAERGDRGLATRQWISGARALTHAGAGELDACNRALDAADQVRLLKTTGPNMGWLRFSESRADELRGECYVALGQSGLAETALLRTLDQAVSPRRRTGVLTGLAMVGVQRRDPQFVVIHTEPVLDLARQTGSGVIRQKLAGLQRQLGPLVGSQDVRLLSREIRALVGDSHTG